MTYAPETLLALRTFLAPHTGLSSGNLGIVGDAAHARRASYHNGRDRMIEFDRLAADYSARTTRDRDGLSNAASALDIGNFAELRELSRWLVARARINAPGTFDIREIIYSPDGERVLRWDRERGFASEPLTGEADNSHLWHTHISWYRDAETRDKVDVFQPFFGGGGMGVVLQVERWNVAAGTPFYEEPNGLQIGQFSRSAVITTLGAALRSVDADGVDFKWRCAFVKSSAVDNKLSWKLVWIHRPVGLPISTDSAWDESIVSLLSDPAGRFPVVIPAPDCEDAVADAMLQVKLRVTAALDGF